MSEKMFLNEGEEEEDSESEVEWSLTEMKVVIRYIIVLCFTEGKPMRFPR